MAVDVCAFWRVSGGKSLVEKGNMSRILEFVLDFVRWDTVTVSPNQIIFTIEPTRLVIMRSGDLA